MTFDPNRVRFGGIITIIIFTYNKLGSAVGQMTVLGFVLYIQCEEVAKHAKGPTGVSGVCPHSNKKINSGIKIKKDKQTKGA